MVALPLPSPELDMSQKLLVVLPVPIRVGILVFAGCCALSVSTVLLVRTFGAYMLICLYFSICYLLFAIALMLIEL